VPGAIGMSDSSNEERNEMAFSGSYDAKRQSADGLTGEQRTTEKDEEEEARAYFAEMDRLYFTEEELEASAREGWALDNWVGGTQRRDFDTEVSGHPSLNLDRVVATFICAWKLAMTWLTGT